MREFFIFPFSFTRQHFPCLFGARLLLYYRIPNDHDRAIPIAITNAFDVTTSVSNNTLASSDFVTSEKILKYRGGIGNWRKLGNGPNE